MQRTTRPEGLDLPSPQLQRNHVSPSDRTPSISGSSFLSPPSVSPDPAYIAASAASQIVNSDRADRGHIPSVAVVGKPEIDTALVSPGSLVLVNTFLDQLLFSFLASSRSTSIASLRPAILEVLKPRLGKEAVDGADEELQGYLAGGDAEELLAFHSGQEFKGEYNLNLVWRRTRLRCMVYTRLGDMEEEDEDTYLEQEQQADGNDGQPRLTRDLGSVSPAAAIFLTSILEFIGEQALLVASEAAYNRVQMKQSNPKILRAVVEEVDMEKLAFNTTLGRLWRSWKKRVRSSSLLSPRPISRDLQRQRTNSLSQGDSASRKTSISEDHGSGYFNNAGMPSAAKVLNGEYETQTTKRREKATDLPDEPDFSDFSTDTASPEERKPSRGRPRSMIDYRSAPSEPATNADSKIQSSKAPVSVKTERRSTHRRQRSSSLPAKQTPYVSPIEETFITPTESPDPFIRESDKSNAEKDMPKLTDASRTVPDLADGNQATSTMYDGAISQSNEVFSETMHGQDDRGISTYTESSIYTDEFENELAPQALNLYKTTGSIAKQLGDSQASGLSSTYEFQAGELNSNSQLEERAQISIGKDIKDDGKALREYGDPTEEPSTGNERQHVEKPAGPSALQGHHLRTYDEKGRTLKRDSPALDEAPFNAKTAASSSTAAQNEGEIRTPVNAKHHLGGSQGVPPLSPLRELMDAAHDTSDEASSNTTSYDASKSDLFVPTHRHRGSGHESFTSSKLSQTQTPTNAGKVSDSRSKPSAINAVAGVEKAAVQRVSSTSTPRSITGRNSTSSNRDGRPMTASSTTSQMSTKIKGIIGRDSGDLARQPMPNRNSSEGSGSLIRTPNKEQDFEELMKSDETVKYTLTPQNMREMETPDSPRYRNNSRSEDAELVDLFRDSGSIKEGPAPPATSRPLTKPKGLNGLRSNPTNSTSPAAATHVQTSPLETVRAPPRSVPKSPGLRSPGAVARDPTTRSDSVRDFADFIRSTGPDSVHPSLPNPVASNPTRTSRPGSSSSSSAAVGRAPPKKVAKQNPIIAPKKLDAQLPKRTISKLEAREPTVTNSNATADLADFLRAGPVDGQLDGAYSSQRSGPAAQPTASFNGLTNGRMREAVNSGSSVASTQDSFTPSKITQSSTNSRTGLLESSNRALPTSAPAKSNNNQRAARKDEPPGPARKQRRPRDPYAIDSDSDNEESYGTPQAPAQREEESLSDFLRNYNPPPESTTSRRSPPPISGAPKPAKHSSPTIRERLARNIAVVPDYRPLPPKTPSKRSSPSSRSPPGKTDEIRNTIRAAESTRRQHSNVGYSPPNQNNIVRGARSSSSSNINTAPPQLPPLNPRATSPHLISQNGVKTDSHRPTQPTYTRPVDRGPAPKQMQARDEGGVLCGGPGLSDLAYFLRETEPPAPSGPIGGTRPMSPVREKEKISAFGKMFGRR